MLQKNKKIIISTGMCHEYEIKKALDVLIQYGVSREMISVYTVIPNIQHQ